MLDRLIATGCPAIEKYKFDFGYFTISGRPRPTDGVDVGYGPRRTILDKLLLDAAAEAGAEVREGFAVEEMLFDDDRLTGLRGHTRGGESSVERARVVIGADGRHSLVAKAVRPEHHNEKPPLQAAYYTYWSDLPAEGFGVYVRPSRGWGVIPTHDNLTLVVIGWPYGEFEANKKDVEGTVPNFFRKPFGPGWALVGDAGYNKDPVTAWGISERTRSN